MSAKQSLSIFRDKDGIHYFLVLIKGNQPKKPVTMQIPLDKNCTANDDLVVVCVNESQMNNKNTFETLQTKPRFVEHNLIFEVSHFST